MKQLTGTVRDGSGASERLFKEGRYTQDYGFEPYHGTLNVEVGADVVDEMVRGEPEQMFKIGQEIWMWQATLTDGNGETLDAWVSIPTMTTVDHVEIIAPVRLRRWLGVSNGDEVTITLTGPSDDHDFTRPYDNIRVTEGASLAAGKAYHQIPGIEGPVYRGGTEKRIDHITEHFDVSGKRGLDLGCSVGGLSVALANKGASMIGHDYDASAVKVGNEIVEKLGADVQLKLTDMTTEEGWESVLTDAHDCDFAIWMSNWMWIAKQAGVKAAERRLLTLSEAVPVLVFETAEAEGSQAGSFGIRHPEDVAGLLTLHTKYTNIQSIGIPDAGWHPRTVFICS